MSAGLRRILLLALLVVLVAALAPLAHAQPSVAGPSIAQSATATGNYPIRLNGYAVQRAILVMFSVLMVVFLVFAAWTVQQSLRSARRAHRAHSSSASTGS